MIRTYTELSRLPTFEERFDYLQLKGRVGLDTFGFDRVFNQMFYHSSEWDAVRAKIIARDCGYDLGFEDENYLITGSIIIHHMNPINLDDIRDATEYLLNPEYLISTCANTHRAIHYGNRDNLSRLPVERSRFDTCPWKH